ncbi:unnamed protein product [Paramecium sonneborni]|uniref:Uncharacterized protein n=1 Tax=Paramecium sonneborni TaxID=65129 RepID=A0A8S1PRR9_9CILI|nr:unnamed protein product [Paramecium sonneborni]
MKSTLINSQSLPQLQSRMIHSKMPEDRIPKPCKYPLFEQPQFDLKPEKHKSRSPLRLNPAIRSTYSKFKASSVKVQSSFIEELQQLII